MTVNTRADVADIEALGDALAKEYSSGNWHECYSEILQHSKDEAVFLALWVHMRLNGIMSRTSLSMLDIVAKRLREGPPEVRNDATGWSHGEVA